MSTPLDLLATVSAHTARVRGAACPEPGCGLPTEVYDEVDLASTDGPIAHARTQCIVGHRFFMPLQNLFASVPNINTGRVGSGGSRGYRPEVAQ